MQIFVTGGSGVLGRASLPRFERAGHTVVAPGHEELDLFDPAAVGAAAAGADAVVHLATRIPPLERFETPGAWDENDRLRTEASRLLVDAALSSGAELYLQAAITFVYPPAGPVDETTPPADELAPNLRSSLAAEAEAARFAESGRRGVVLRFGLLYGPGTWSEAGPHPSSDAPLHVDDAGAALEVALDIPSGIYNVVADGSRVSNSRFKQTTGWAPQH